MSFADLPPFKPLYEGPGGVVLRDFVAPCVGRSVRYDRITSFFNVGALVAISTEIHSMWSRGGKVRLVLGEHDVPRELVEAARTDDAARAVLVQEVRDRLVRQVSSLGDEMTRNRIATLAWMMEDDLLEVRVAFPVGQPTDSIFHSKRMIFTDGSGAVVTGVGSPNETAAAFERNFEEVTVHCSWIDPMGHVPAHVESFERIWCDQREDLLVVPFTNDLAPVLLEACRNPDRPETGSVVFNALLDAARISPSLWPVNLGSVALYPHQERAVRDGLSRWPIRVLLADEVGLGKTIEGGAIVAYSLRHNVTDDCIILAPRNLLSQWADELRLHFGIDAWIYESDRGVYRSPTGAEIHAPGGPLDRSRPSVALVSIDLARGTRRDGHKLAGGVLPGMLVVDEAHRARVRRDSQGNSRSTLAWEMLDDIRDQVPHLVLLTATPMQLDPREYHSMLQLLGLPEYWRDERHYLRSLSLLAGRRSDSAVQDAADALRLISSSVAFYGAPSRELSEVQERFLERLASDESIARISIDAESERDEIESLLLYSHPAARLTIRNSRSTLESLGYRFPSRDFTAPSLDIDPAIVDLYERVDTYLAEAYGKTEAAISGGGLGLGFTRSTYRQRIASSLAACGSTMTNRLQTIERHLHVTDIDVTPAVHFAATVEKAYVNDVLHALERVDERSLPDPKLEEMVAQLSGRVRGDRALVFSRYTDTVAACIARWSAESDDAGIACYTGPEVWIQSGGKRFNASKVDVQDALANGTVEIVFCSDAASEGLNLQAARVLINVDVPWNPARLEQRIGRIARLGQQAETVSICNLWYPDSVEMRMYSRLLKRRQLYQIAVGEFPQIVDDSIVREVESRLGGAVNDGTDALVRLNEARTTEQMIAIQRVWDSDRSDIGSSANVRRDLLGMLAYDEGLWDSPYSASAGSRFPITLHAPELESIPPQPSPREQGVFDAWVDPEPIAFRYSEEDDVHDVPPSGLVGLLLKALGYDINLSRWAETGPAIGAWLPDHGETVFGEEWEPREVAFPSCERVTNLT